MTMYHGSSSAILTLHPGLCLTPDDAAARDYANYAFGTHVLHQVSIDLDGLTVIDVAGDWDHDEAKAASDDGGDYGADIIVYDDESPFNRGHLTWRLMTPAALAAVTVTGSRDAEDW